MYERAVEDEPDNLEFVSGYLKMQEMCEKAVEECSYILEDVPDHFKMEKMCDAVVVEDSLLLRHVPDWFVTQQQVKLRGAAWYKGYKKRKSQKALIKEELMPITWHLSRYWGWCMSEDEENETEKL